MHFKTFILPIVQNLTGQQNIVFSWDSKPSKEYAVYQLEQLSVQGKLSANYIDLLRSAKIIFDYSKKNLELYPKDIRSKVEFLPLLPKIQTDIIHHNTNDKDIDILFYGYLSPRRNHLLRQLHNLGNKIVYYDDLDFNQMQSLVQKSKFVLSYGTWSNHYNDCFRVSVALNLGGNILYEETQEKWYDEYIFNNFADRITLIKSLCKTFT